MLENYTSTFPRAECWEALAEGRFELPRCGTCDEWQSPGARRCGRCGSDHLGWQAASGKGRVYSLLERLVPSGSPPSAIIVVSLDEGPMVMGVTDARPEVGMRVSAKLPQRPGPDGLLWFAESAN